MADFFGDGTRDDCCFVAPDAQILVVDDISTNLAVTSSFLDEYRCRADTCTDGSAAVHMVQQKRYDIVFMDYMMPNLNGIKAMQRIRALEGGNYLGLPIIALTANATQGAREMFLSEGFSDYLNKPIESSKLNGILRKWIPSEKLIWAPDFSAGEPNEKPDPAAVRADGTYNHDKEGPAVQDENEEREDNIFDGIAIDGIDLQKGNRNFSQNVYMDVLRAWCKHIPANLEKLRALKASAVLPGGNLKDYVIAVHGFKGSGYGICAEGLGQDAEALEAAGRRGDVAFIEANNGLFMEKTGLLHARLSKFLADRQIQENARPMADSPDAELLAQLLDACRHYRSSAMEEVLKRLEAFDYESDGELVHWLRDQVDNLEYDAIVERLSGMDAGD